MNIFLGLHPEGITVFLGFGSDCSLFSQKEFPWGSSWIWFVTSESWHLEVCQASAFGWYTLPFNGNLPPPLPTHTQFQVGGTTFFFFFSGKITATQSHISCVWAVTQLWDALDVWGTRQPAGCILRSKTSASYCSHMGWLSTSSSLSSSGPGVPDAGETANPPNHGTARRHCHQTSHVLGMTAQLNQEFQPAALCFIGFSSLKQTPPEGQLRKVMKHKPEKKCARFGHFIQFCQHSRNTCGATSPQPSSGGCTKWRNVKEDFRYLQKYARKKNMQSLKYARSGFLN